MKKIIIHSIFLLWGALIISCSSYKQNIMFKVPKGYALQRLTESAEQNYIIQKSDYLTLEVYTNNGERLIDPNQETTKEGLSKTAGDSPPKYLVDILGLSRFPMIGEIKLEGLTLKQAEQILQKEYAHFYQEPFVTLKNNNKRVIVLGSPGGQVIPLLNENLKLTEVIALAKGIDNTGKAHNIRVLREKEVFVIDLSSIDGYLNHNMIMKPGDIVYIEPLRRPLIEGLRDYLPILSAFVSITTLIIVFTK